MATTLTENTQRSITLTIDADGSTDPVPMEDYPLRSYQLVRESNADGTIGVEVTADPDQNDWHQLESQTVAAFASVDVDALAIRFTLSGNTQGSWTIHLMRFER